MVCVDLAPSARPSHWDAAVRAAAVVFLVALVLLTAAPATRMNVALARKIASLTKNIVAPAMARRRTTIGSLSWAKSVSRRCRLRG
eukprot:scaffold134716_cov31-Tisochrysis_lutea.AAC.2